MGNIKGKSAKAMSLDISEGYVIVNPIFLKPLDHEDLKEVYHQLDKLGKEIRAERFPFSDTLAIRKRNMRLQRLHSASMIIRNYARERKIILV